MLKISYAGCLGLSLMVSAQFTLEMCIAARNREKFTKTLLHRWLKVIMPRRDGLTAMQRYEFTLSVTYQHIGWESKGGQSINEQLNLSAQVSRARELHTFYCRDKRKRYDIDSQACKLYIFSCMALDRGRKACRASPRTCIVRAAGCMGSCSGWQSRQLSMHHHQ